MKKFTVLNKVDQKIFFTSDLHFGDDRLNLYGRDLVFKNSKEFEFKIIDNWNKIVTKNDLVIVVGDVALTRDGLSIMAKLNGKKYLVKGNYDNKDGTAKYNVSDELLKEYFDKVVDDMEIEIDGEMVYINHYPTSAKASSMNICGHVHGTWKVQRNMINVSCDAWHFMPISMDMIKFQINGIRNHYDQNVFAGELLSNIDVRKNNIQILKAPEYNKTINDDFVIFLMGPIQGAEEWHDKFFKKISEIKTEKNIIIASPKRDNIEDFIYSEQVDWESYYLDKAAKNGLIFCWLAKEKEILKGRSYAQTTRFEIGEFFSYKKKNNLNIIIGADKSFNGTKYIEYKFKQLDEKFEILSDFDLAFNEVKKMLK